MGQSWNKVHDASKNSYWKNLPSTDTPIVKDELNRNETSVDTIDDRVITLDTTKAEQSDFLGAFLSVTFNSSTGTFTFTKANGTTVVIDTDIEKIAINFDYDDDPTSAHYQQLIIELDDGTYKYVDLSALITEYEFTDTTTIHFAVGNDGSVTANVIDGSITEAKLQPNFLADCRAARTGAENAEADAIAKALVSEGWARGTQNNVPVTSGSPYYHDNAKYWKDQAQAIASGSISGLSDVEIDTVTLADKQVLTYDSTTQMWENKNPEVNRLKSLDMVGKTTTFNADGSINCEADDYESKTEFNANGSITERLRYNGKNLLSGIEHGTWTTSTQTKAVSNNRARSTELIKTTPSTTLVFSCVSGGSKTVNWLIHGYSGLGSGKNVYDSGWKSVGTAITLPNNVEYIDLLFKTTDDSSTPEDYITNAQLEVGSPATTYEPYYNYVKTTHFMGNDIIEDLHDYQGCVDLGSLNWYAGSGFFDTDVIDIASVSTDIYCKEYPTGDIAYFVNNPSIVGIAVSGTSKFRFYNSSYTTTAQVKTALSGVYLTYKTTAQ